VPAKKADEYPVSVQKNDAGDFVLGFAVEGVFVPLSQKLGVHVNAIVEKAKVRGLVQKDDDEGES
jgi:hypothetical protein